MRLIWLSLLLFFSSCGNSPFINKNKQDESEGKANQSSLKIEKELTEELSYQPLGVNEEKKISKIILNGLWQVKPQLTDPARLIVTLVDEKFDPLDVELKTFLWMPGMGHGSFPITHKKIGTGVFMLSDLYFTMPGDWDVHFQIKSKNKEIAELIWPIFL